MPVQPNSALPTPYIPNALDQYADVVTLHNALALTSCETTAHIAALKAMKDTMLRTMSVIFRTEAQKAAFSAQSRRFSGVTKLQAYNRVHILVLEQWGKGDQVGVESEEEGERVVEAKIVGGKE
jgi:hypothetical protein